MFPRMVIIIGRLMMRMSSVVMHMDWVVRITGVMILTGVQPVSNFMRSCNCIRSVLMSSVCS